jgi:hypothetical protein
MRRLDRFREFRFLPRGLRRTLHRTKLPDALGVSSDLKVFLGTPATQDTAGPDGSPAHVLHYLARYTHRVAISNHRLVAVSNDTAATQSSKLWPAVALSSNSASPATAVRGIPRGSHLAQQRQGQAPFRCERYRSRNLRARLLSRCQPLLGQIQRRAQQPRPRPGPRREGDGGLTVRDLAARRSTAARPLPRPCPVSGNPSHRESESPCALAAARATVARAPRRPTAHTG